MTKRNLTRPTRRTLDTAELATVTGGYTLTLSYDLTAALNPYYATISNITKAVTTTSSGTVDNTK